MKLQAQLIASTEDASPSKGAQSNCCEQWSVASIIKGWVTRDPGNVAIQNCEPLRRELANANSDAHGTKLSEEFTARNTPLRRQPLNAKVSTSSRSRVRQAPTRESMERLSASRPKPHIGIETTSLGQCRKTKP